jgi:hypothetical protein
MVRAAQKLGAKRYPNKPMKLAKRGPLKNKVEKKVVLRLQETVILKQEAKRQAMSRKKVMGKMTHKNGAKK